MKRIIFAGICLISYIHAIAGDVTVDGSRSIEITPPTSTGLNSVFVIENTDVAELSYFATNQSISWQRYSNLGGGYAEEVQNISKDGNKYTVKCEINDIGYIITDGSKQICVWVVNYANYTNNIPTAIQVESSDCDRVILRTDKEVGYINYYTINGRQEHLDRKFELIYNTLVYSENDGLYNQVSVTENIEGFTSTFSVQVPLCDTEFKLTPDRFAKEWGIGSEIISQSFKTSAVQAQTSATQTIREVDNEQKVEAELGGSAPCEIQFKAAITDAAIYHRWEISTYPEFDEIQLQYNDLEFTGTFTDAGMTYVRFIANNAEGTCEFISDTYTISIGDSRLECPNAFSPGTSEGVNDLWKVTYRSIVTFNCQIFNRWGQKIIELTDPSQGWDGYYKGKLVGSGTYFYVIKATGADGKDYDLSGHINIINSRRNNMGQSAPVE